MPLPEMGSMTPLTYYLLGILTGFFLLYFIMSGLFKAWRGRSN